MAGSNKKLIAECRVLADDNRNPDKSLIANCRSLLKALKVLIARTLRSKQNAMILILINKSKAFSVYLSSFKYIH